MARFLPDTSVIVAAVCTWHVHHSAAIAELDRRLGNEAMIVAGQTLVETYAVLTRLPAPYRLSAADAQALISANFVEKAEIVALESVAYPALLKRAAASGIVGGQTYDAVVAECARVAAVDALVTFNERHFRGLMDGAMTLVVPTAQ